MVADAGPWLRRTCDALGNCYDGWPFTQNDGFLGALWDAFDMLLVYAPLARALPAIWRSSLLTMHGV